LQVLLGQEATPLVPLVVARCQVLLAWVVVVEVNPTTIKMVLLVVPLAWMALRQA